MGAFGAGRSSCEAFEEQLIDWCENEGVDAIAEEMSDKAWERAQEVSTVLFDTTVPRKVAGSLGLAHRDCENDLEIPEITDVKMGAWVTGSDEAEALKKRDAMRERHWMRTLASWRQGRVLFVCGSCHVTSLQERLENGDIETRVLARDWAPESRSSGA